MLPTNLENYLISCRNQNIPFPQVSQKMQEAGWGSNDILEAEYWYHGKLPATNSQSPLLHIDAKVTTTPAALDKYPGQQLSPIVVFIIFLALTIVTFFVLQIF